MTDAMQRPPLLDFATLVPKVELHAHLHGCIRPETVRDLAAANGITISPAQHKALAPGGDRSLSDCFNVFDVIHSVVCGIPAVRRIALEALKDMRRHNVRYAELRTTPRPLPDGASRREYIENVLRVFREFETDQAPLPCEVSDGACIPCHGEDTNKGLPRLIPRLLLSVDRGKNVQEAMTVAELAVQLRTEEEWRPYVVGVDFSGNPTKGSFEEFRPAFELARRGGLKVTVHCGEVPDGPDFLQVIAFKPERLGHAVVLTEEVREALLSVVPRIPIEVCPTSNLLTLSLSDYGDHPTVQGWISEGYPFSVNTDDPGVFNTDLPTEYAHLAAHNGMDRQGLAQLACRAVEDIFDDDLRPALAESFRQECDVLLGAS